MELFLATIVIEVLIEMYFRESVSIIILTGDSPE